MSLEQVRRQADLAKRFLKSAGYHANPGKNTYSRIASDTGTSAYLTRRVIEGTPYLGIGLGSQSYTNSTIAYNAGAASKSIGPYAKMISEGRLPIQDFYQLPARHMMAKMIAVSFYFGEINLERFNRKFGLSLEEALPASVQFALREGLMEYRRSENGAEIADLKRESLSLTEKGARHFNGTIALFFAPSVQRFLISGEAEKSMDVNARAAAGVSLRNDTVAAGPVAV